MPDPLHRFVTGGRVVIAVGLIVIIVVTVWGLLEGAMT